VGKNPELMPYADVAGKPGAIPDFTLWEGNGETELFAIPIPWAALIIIAEKIACGCEYKLKDRYVEFPYGIRTFITNPNVIKSFFVSSGKRIDFGPGCQMMRVCATEDSKVVRYRIAIWGTLCFEVLIDLEDELRKVEATFSRVQGITLTDDHGKMLISPYLRMRH
jgi:hypothetical protein